MKALGDAARLPRLGRSARRASPAAARRRWARRRRAKDQRTIRGRSARRAMQPFGRRIRGARGRGRRSFHCLQWRHGEADMGQAVVGHVVRGVTVLKHQGRGIVAVNREETVAVRHTAGSDACRSSRDRSLGRTGAAPAGRGEALAAMPLDPQAVDGGLTRKAGYRRGGNAVGGNQQAQDEQAKPAAKDGHGFIVGSAQAAATASHALAGQSSPIAWRSGALGASGGEPGRRI